MAKLVLTIAVICVFFAFSHARTPADLPVADVITDESLNDHLETATLRLPSERDESEPVTKVEWVRESTESKRPETTESFDKPDESEPSDSVPLTVISFRPINRHFPRRPFPLTFRRGHPCRHSHPQFKPWDPRPQRREVSYGNDMIVSDELRFKPVSHNEDQPQIPARWSTFRQVGPRFPFRHDDEMERPHHHHHHRFRHHHVEGGENEEREVEHEHNNGEGGFMMRVRKFLNHF
ncbi:hypothetical protein FNV43_RR09404 [Rhamnella rubrinervis]|uniref:Uncharacterized protein n=1 Tax=Rhamnella rubrinervis TaxID=2594499 RepID=A0A8K0HAE2_9ROSA|nr:hypothetical protein FNV43_RR09404 [Rhamnella rubrinervis]